MDQRVRHLHTVPGSFSKAMSDPMADVLRTKLLRTACRAARPVALLLLALQIFSTSGLARSDVTQTDVPEIASLRDLLELWGIDESHLANLGDGRPLNGGDIETLLQLFFRLEGSQPGEIARFGVETLDVAKLASEPDTYRGVAFLLSGRVVGVKPQRPGHEMDERLNLPVYYRCNLLLDDGQPAILYVRHVPKAWLSDAPLDTPARATGIFLKLASADTARPEPIFVARSIAWHPDTPLARLGMDVGLLDKVQDRKRLMPADRECFYAMLAAVGRAKPGQLLREANMAMQADHEGVAPDDQEPRFSVVPLFNDVASQRGRLIALSGTVRRVERIRVDDADVRQRYGIDHYYTLYLFTADSQGNPVVFCVRDLPEGMPLGDGPGYGESVRVAGFFMKTWAYRVDLPRDDDANDSGGPRLQLAPLLLGREPVWYRPDAAAGHSMAQAVGGALFVLVMAIIWFVLWRNSRGNRRFRERFMANARIAPPKA